jgi:hypothetical protein
MQVQTIRTIEEHLDRPGRMRFVVQFHIAATPDDRSHLTLYGARALEALFPDDVDLVKLLSVAGVARAFDWVEDANAFIDQVEDAKNAAHLAWLSAASFVGDDRG